MIDVPFLIRGGGVLLFAFAALMDWRYRRVQNHVWGLIATLGVIALLLELIEASNRLAITIGVVLCTLLVSTFALFAFSTGWVGGADAKAAIVLPIIFPRFPGQPIEDSVYIFFLHFPWQPAGNGVFTALTQGVEVGMWVCLATGIARTWYILRMRIHGNDAPIPFLVPMFAGILSLVAIALFVI